VRWEEGGGDTEHERIFKEFCYTRLDKFPQISSSPALFTNLGGVDEFGKRKFSLTLFYSVINIFRYLSDKLANGGGGRRTNDGGYAK